MIKVRPKNIGARVNIPSWLGDPDKIAPCVCGLPALQGQPVMMMEGELGLRSWLHVACWQLMGGEGEWDDDEDED